VGAEGATELAGAGSAAKSVCGAVALVFVPSGLPHFVQNCELIPLAAPHWEQKRSLGPSADGASTCAPHLVQKCGLPSSDDPHLAQTIGMENLCVLEGICSRRYRASGIFARHRRKANAAKPCRSLPAPW
jgi:hypothetical protein